MSGLVSGLVGIQTQAAQPSFSAKNSVQDTNVTGNGATYTVDFDSERYDQNADFASDTFTAPVTGKYLLTTHILSGTVTSAADSETIRIKTSNSTYESFIELHLIASNNDGQMFAVIADMDASDTVTVELAVTGESSDVVNVQANYTIFMGHLLG
jgi:hypothetical protein